MIDFFSLLLNISMLKFLILLFTWNYIHNVVPHIDFKITPIPNNVTVNTEHVDTRCDGLKVVKLVFKNENGCFGVEFFRKLYSLQYKRQDALDQDHIIIKS